MTGAFAELHHELRQVARDLLCAGAGPARASPDWSQLSAAGWLGLEVAEDLGGAGATFAEVCVILRELGRAASRSGYLGTAALGVGALNLLDAPAAQGFLRRAAAGEVRLAVALPTGDETVARYRLERHDSGLRLDGESPFVPDAAEAHHVLVAACDPQGVPVMVLLEPRQTGVSVSQQPVLDETRRFGVVTVADAHVSGDAVWRFRGDPVLSMRRLLDRGAVAVACDSLGVAEAMLDATVAYAGVRQQFGRFIGSFQAVKHACADMLVHVTVGRELLEAAVQAVSTEPLESAGVSAAVAMAKSFISGGAVDVAGKAMQLHGGYGYTWESGVHRYLKRAALGRSLFGSPAFHRRTLAARYLANSTAVTSNG